MPEFVNILIMRYGGEGMRRILFRTLFVLAMALGLLDMHSKVAMAQGEPPLVREERVGNVRYMSGGVGLEERSAMEAAKGFDLKLVFAMVSKEYLSGINVLIQDSGGKTILSAESAGPWFLLDLPEGEYTIQVAMGNQKQVRKVNVGKGMQTLNFLWR
jgi:hypothetical protein